MKSKARFHYPGLYHRTATECRKFWTLMLIHELGTCLGSRTSSSSLASELEMGKLLNCLLFLVIVTLPNVGTTGQQRGTTG